MAYPQNHYQLQQQQQQQYAMRHMMGPSPGERQSRTLPRGGGRSAAPHPPALRTTVMSPEAAARHGRAPLPPHWNSMSKTRSRSTQNIHENPGQLHVVNISFDEPPPQGNATMSRTEGHNARLLSSNDGNWIFRGDEGGRGRRKQQQQNNNSLAMRNMVVSQQMASAQTSGVMKVQQTPSQGNGEHIARATGGMGTGHRPTPQRSQSHDDVLSRGGDRVQVQRDFRSSPSPGLSAQVPAYNRSRSNSSSVSTPPVSPHIRTAPATPTGRPPPHGYAGQIIYMQQSPGSPGYAISPQPRYIRKVSRSPSEASHLTSASSSSSNPRTPTHQAAILAQVVPAPGSRTGSRAPSRSNSVPDLIEAALMDEDVFMATMPRSSTSGTVNESESPHLDAVVPPPPSSPSARKFAMAPSSDVLDSMVDPGGSVRGSIYSGTFVRVNVTDFARGEEKRNGESNLREMRRIYHSEPSLADGVDGQLEMTPEQLEHARRQEAVSSGTIARAYSPGRENAPRTVVLQKGGSGFGFVLRGAKDLALELAQTQQPSSLDFAPSPDFPALQYLDRVDRSSMADRAGLKPGDFVLEINGESVVNATHEHTVQLIKRSGDTLAMKVVTVKPLSTEGMDVHMDGTRTLPMKKKALAPVPPKRNPHTSLTGTAAGKAKSMLDSLAELERLDRTLALYDEDTRSMGPHATTSALDAAANRRGVDPNNKTASIRSRHSGKRLTAFELEDIFTRQGDTSGMQSQEPLVVLPPKAYASPTEQKVARMKGRASPANSTASLSRARSTPSLVPAPGQQNHHHVTRVVIQDGVQPAEDGRVMYNRQHTTNGQGEVLYAVPLKPDRRERHASADSAVYAHSGIPPSPREPPPRPPSQSSSQSGDSIPPPPTHKPPPVPGDQDYIQILQQPTYANISEEIQKQEALRRQTSYESSFRPGVVAKLSKEPAPLPPGAVPPQRVPQSVSSSSSMSSSSSPDHYGRPPSVASSQSTHRYEQRVMHSESSNQPSTQDSVHENARRFMQDNPNASMLVTSEEARSHHPAPTSRAQYYEPEPDYETVSEAISRNTTKTHTEDVVINYRQTPSPAISRQTPSPAVSRQSSSPSVSRQSPAPDVRQPVSRQSPAPEVRQPVSRQSPAPEVRQPSPAPISRASPAPVVVHSTRTTEVVKTVETEAPSVRSLRENWQSKQVQKSVDETDRTVLKPTSPTTPKAQENTMSAFGNAIKAAAVAREKRSHEEKVVPPAPAPAAAAAAPPPAPLKKPPSPPPPPPAGPPPPPPPPPISTPPSSQPPTLRKNNMPPHIQKSLEESRQREDTHAAIMAAVARRRNLVENENMEKVADTIENKVQKAKKIQSTVYKRDGGKEIVTPTSSGPKKAPTPPPKAVVVERSVKTTEVLRSEAVKMEEKSEQVKRPPEEVKSPAANLNTAEQKTLESTNFTALAEKARQDWLLKKTGQTLERKKKDTPDETDNNNKKGCAPSPPVRQNQTPNGGTGGIHRGNGSPAAPSSAVGDLAAIIAQKAAARQKSYESNGNGNSNGNVGNGIGNNAVLGVNTNSNNKNSHYNVEKRQSVEIGGATLDSSNTENAMSVMKRTQIFGSQKALLKKSPPQAGTKTVYRAEGSRSEGPILPPPAFGDDLPPPMVPPPHATGELDIISNGHSRHGQETVGWVINSGRQSDRDYSIQNKISQRHAGMGGPVNGSDGDVSTMRLVRHEELEMAPAVADVVEMDFIPPPPFFDSEEMNAIVGTQAASASQQPEDAISLVSSLSTLSTLSSTEQDAGAGSPRFSLRSSTYTINPESEIGVAPPPPGFDDILDPPAGLSSEMSGSLEFIPPPMGFDVSPPADPAPVTSLRHVMRRRGYQEKSIDTWSTSDVCEWLESLHLSNLSSNFSSRSVSGEQLMKMGRNELIAIGVSEVSDRMNIERAIKRAIMRR